MADLLFAWHVRDSACSKSVPRIKIAFRVPFRCLLCALDESKIGKAQVAAIAAYVAGSTAYWILAHAKDTKEYCLVVVRKS